MSLTVWRGAEWVIPSIVKMNKKDNDLHIHIRMAMDVLKNIWCRG